jgi:hypothetical protein
VIYEYLCQKCNVIDEVEKTSDLSTRPEFCVTCQNPMERQFSPPQLMKIGVDEPTFNPAFGTHMTRKQAAEEARRKGWVEIGNDKPQAHAPKVKEYVEREYFL